MLWPLLSSVFLGAQAGYIDLGPGRCKHKNGDKMTYAFYGGKGTECQQLCDEDSECHGYSASRFDNCLLWEVSRSLLVGGGGEWGDAHCLVQDGSHAASHRECVCEGGSCPWKMASGCVEKFQYKGKEYHGCTEVDFQGRGWCSHFENYKEYEFSHCTMQCPSGCYWRQPSQCVPVPQQEQCWQAPPECVPEFWYKRNFYAGCTSVDATGPAWCSHFFRYATAHEWSSCTRCKDCGDGQYCASCHNLLQFVYALIAVLCFLFMVWACRDNRGADPNSVRVLIDFQSTSYTEDGEECELVPQ